MRSGADFVIIDDILQLAEPFCSFLMTMSVITENYLMGILAVLEEE